MANNSKALDISGFKSSNRKVDISKFQPSNNEPKPLSDFLGEFGKNLYNAPGKMVSEMGNVISGQSAKNIEEANKKYGEDLKSGKEKPWYTENKEEPVSNLLKKIGGESMRALPSIVGGALEGTGNLINTGYDLANPMMTPEQKKFKPGNILTGAGQSAKGLGTLISGVPQESATGELSSFAGELAPISGPSSKVSSLLKGGEKVKTVLGSLLRGKKILEGSKMALEGGEAVNLGEKVLNALPNLVKAVGKSSIKGAADTVLYTGASEGRLPNPTELTTGTLASNALDIFGAGLQKLGKSKYRKAVSLFSGNNEGIDTLNRKTGEAIEEGFTGGKDPAVYSELADRKIASYSKAVQDEMSKNNVKFGTTFIDNIKSKIEELQKNLPEKAKHMQDALDRFMGKSYKEDLDLINTKVSNLNKNLAGYEQSLEIAKKKGNIGSINKIESSVRNEAVTLGQLKKQQSYLTDLLPKVTKDGFDLFDLQKIRQIAAEKNPNIVAGITAPSVKEAAENELWMLMRDESEKYLNNALPHLKDINSRLNVAYRIKDSVTPFLKDTTKEMKKGTTFAGQLYNRGKDLQKFTTKILARKGLKTLLPSNTKQQ